MILDALLSLIFTNVNSFLNLLPDLSFPLDINMFSSVLRFLHVIVWILPIETILVIFGLQISIGVFRITISLIKTLWDLIPFV